MELKRREFVETTDFNSPFGQLITWKDSETGDPFFLAKQVGLILGYKHGSLRMAISRYIPWNHKCSILLLDTDVANIIKNTIIDDVTNCDTINYGSGKTREYTIISLMAVNTLISHSRTYVAKQFQNFVNGTVLPTVLNTGKYEDQDQYLARMYTQITHPAGIIGNYRDQEQARELGVNTRKAYASTMFGTNHSKFQMAQMTNRIYLAAFGYTAQEIKDILGLRRQDGFRELLSSDAQNMINSIEMQLEDIISLAGLNSRDENFINAYTKETLELRSKTSKFNAKTASVIMIPFSYYSEEQAEKYASGKPYWGIRNGELVEITSKK